MWSRKFIDLTGSRFGRLYVIGLAPEKRYNKPAWLCRCDCGRVKVVAGNPLRTGKTRSCGCLHNELVAASAHGGCREMEESVVAPLLPKAAPYVPPAVKPITSSQIAPATHPRLSRFLIGCESQRSRRS
jgi:hypothetical protein